MLRATLSPGDIEFAEVIDTQGRRRTMRLVCAHPDPSKHVIASYCGHYLGQNACWLSSLLDAAEMRWGGESKPPSEPDISLTTFQRSNFVALIAERL